MWLDCSCDVREEVLPGALFLGRGAAEPLLVMRQAEAGVIAGGKALIVQLCAEVFGMGVCGHLPWVSRRAQETPDEFIHTDRLGAGYFNRAIDRLPDGNVGQDISDIIGRNRLHKTW